MMRLRAVCASDVISSASSSMMILKGMSAKAAKFENRLTFSRTMLMPRSSDALSSSRLSGACLPSTWRAMHSAVVVLPTPADPENIRCGMSPGLLSSDDRLPMASDWPATSSSFCGLYFSTHIAPPGAMPGRAGPPAIKIGTGGPRRLMCAPGAARVPAGRTLQPCRGAGAAGRTARGMPAWLGRQPGRGGGGGARPPAASWNRRRQGAARASGKRPAGPGVRTRT